MSTKSRILDIALNVFSHHGFRQTSMELVAENVGVTRQALYRHYASKEALFAAVAEMLHAGALDAAIQAMEVAASENADLADVAVAGLQARFGHILSRLAVSPYAVELLEEHDRHCGAITAEYGRRFEAVLAERLGREASRRGRAFANGLTPETLARYLFLGAKSLKSTVPPPRPEVFAPDLKQFVGVMIAGAFGLSSQR
ncbi:TetR/AcrR family transcriptional regulator [Brucella sp. IR073]|uniref:TetR/AcrR family transcriptional regulator n=1 Tax=unclassified Brucella TaxID=2632610 RepID=UPI003B97FA74